MANGVIRYATPGWVVAFTTGRNGGVESVGLRTEELALPRQVHSDRVCRMREAGRPEQTDAVVVDRAGLCACVKTADCIPVLLYDERQRVVAAVHAGWRGTVARIVQKTIEEMCPVQGSDLHAIIGPGISLESFEVGEEVCEAFCKEGFPMERIARRFPVHGGSRWHVDLWEANRWLLGEMGVEDVFVEGTCTMTSPDFFSARREGINTGRNYSGIMIIGSREQGHGESGI